MTLDPSSTLGRALPCLVGAGGAEVAFAATRSLLVTLALHAGVLCGDRRRRPRRGRQPAASARTAARRCACARWPARRRSSFSGRGVFRGVAEAASLMLMELARMPALGFEIGQFRHGPLELLSPDDRRRAVCAAKPIERRSRAWRRRPPMPARRAVIFDCSGGKPVGAAATCRFAAAPGSRGRLRRACLRCSA